MRAQTFTSAASVELATVERGGFIESRHAGSALVLSPTGEVVTALGDTSAPVLPRSSLKPLQAIGSVTAGAPLEGAHLAVATASHSGTDRHVGLVRDILAAGGFDDSALGCPAQAPSDPTTRDALIASGTEPGPVRMNCSGKHAAMLLACHANGWDTASYLDAEHPLQVHIREIIERFSGERVQATVTDGCGAPVHALSLAGLARAIHRIGTSSERSPFAMHRVAGALVRAVRDNPWTIDGEGRSDTLAIERFGVFSKLGAEGVQTMIAPDGTTVVLKMLDGALRATSPVALTLLARAGALDPDEVDDYVGTHRLFALFGGGREVGRIRVAV